MYNTQLNYLIAQQRIDEARRDVEQARIARSLHDDRPAPRRIARLRPRFIGRRAISVS